jgi:hypothetical protein
MAHTEHTPSQSNPSPEAVAAGYEPHDLRLRGVFVFVGVLAVTLLVVLAFIYAVMMALVDHDRSHDAISSPITVTLPPVYAPLQPSREHPTLDADDMFAMRQKAQADLAASGISSTGRRYISINAAMDKVIAMNLLPIRPVVSPVVQPPNPAGTWEGYTPNLGPVITKPMTDSASE